METWRLFIAIKLPPDALRAIGRQQGKLKTAYPGAALRWVNPDGIHLTLMFLGDVSPERVAAIQAGLGQAVHGIQPFDLAIEKLGCFPDASRPRVVWVGITGDIEPLRRLQAGVERQIAPLGFETEKRAFSPHLTLARVKQYASRSDAAAVGEMVRQQSVGQIARWQVTGINLFRSHLAPTGATYEQLCEVTLER
jgi:2'-5' RNA ligase